MTDAIKLAIEQAWDKFCDGFDLHANEWLDKGAGEMFEAGYLAALKAQRTLLSDEQIETIAKPFISTVGSHWENDEAIRDGNGDVEKFARAIEAAHGIKL